MKKNFCLLVAFVHFYSFSANPSILECENIGNFNRNSNVQKTEQEKKIFNNILIELGETVSQYQKLDIDEKKIVFTSISTGLKNIFKSSDIGSGNIVLFTALSQLRNFMIADLIKIDQTDFVLATATKETNVQLSIEQLREMLKKEFKLEDLNIKSNQAELILSLLPPFKQDETSELYPYARFLNSPGQQIELKTFFQMFQETDYLTIVRNYSRTEIENAIAFSALSLYQMQKNKMKLTLEKIYLDFRDKMNPFQAEIYKFEKQQYNRDTQRYIVLNLKNLSENFIESFSKEIPKSLIFGLNLENEE